MKSRQERIEAIKRIEKVALEDDSNKNYYTIKNWRGKPLYKKIIRVDSEFLMFRIENSRTEIQQLSFIRKNSLSEDFFNDPESVAAQEAQESILIGMVKAKGKDFLEDLKIREQDDSCIITYDGYIVDGNRRTSALKHLGERYIDCVVLPEDASPKDIYILEQQIQISEDFKEPYHWINELRNIRKGKEDTKLDLSEKELALNLRLETKDVKEMLRKLDLVDAFLNWKNIAGEYDYPKLDDAEEIFRQLEKAIKKYSKDHLKREALQHAVFNLIEQRPTSGRLYGHVTALIRTFDQVYAKMIEEERKKEAEETEKDATPDEETKVSDGGASDDPLDGLISEGEEDKKPELFNKPEKAAETSTKLVETVKDVVAETKERKDAEAVYDGVSTALREIQGLTIDNETTKLGSIKSKLAQIIEASERLLVELKDYED